MADIFYKTLQHVLLVVSSLLIASFIAMPLGFFLTRIKKKRISQLIIRAAALIQTIPGIAMLALIVALLASLNSYLAIPTSGTFPAVLALSFYAVFPILTNTYTGIQQVSPTVIEVAQGMGLKSRQVLFLVELPLAVPFIFSGMRISSAWTIGMATLTSMIGSGGLGDLVMQGLRSLQPTLVLAGTIPAAILVIGFEAFFTRLENWLTKAAS
jgi:osmoprotectant transport system permease protein